MNDIDIVVLWVDGNDPEWQKEKAKYQGVKLDDSNSANRYRDWDLMKYWFRGIEKFMPWVRKIHFVTWGHLPSFLDVNNPRINIVRHEDYLPEYARPTFNACSIEMNLHRIEGLSEHFVFFNDDMFVLRPISQERFFQNDKPVAYFAEVPTSFSGVLEAWQYMFINDLGIINKYFNKRQVKKQLGKNYSSKQYSFSDRVRTEIMYRINPDGFTGFKNFHCPVGFNKKTFQEIWENEPDILKRTSEAKFRTPHDVNQWLLIWWQILSGNFVPGKCETAVFPVNVQNVDGICDLIKGQRKEMVCLNDPSGCDDISEMSAKLQSAFEIILPEKSSFEL